MARPETAAVDNRRLQKKLRTTTRSGRTSRPPTVERQMPRSEKTAKASAINSPPTEASADAIPASEKSARTASAPISHPARAPERKRICSDRERGGLRPAAGDVEKRVVLGVGAGGDANAFASERTHDDVACEAGLREGEAQLPEGQPHEVGL